MRDATLPIFDERGALGTSFALTHMLQNPERINSTLRDDRRPTAWMHFGPLTSYFFAMPLHSHSTTQTLERKPVLSQSFVTKRLATEKMLTFSYHVHGVVGKPPFTEQLDENVLDEVRVRTTAPR